jgi:hypothetical protein
VAAVAAAAAAAVASAAAAARAWDKRTMRRAAPSCLVVGKGRLNRAMVDGIGENDMLCELEQNKQYKIRGNMNDALPEADTSDTTVIKLQEVPNCHNITVTI